MGQFRNLIERVYWGVVRRMWPVQEIDGIAFVDMRQEGGDTARLGAILKEAMSRISAAKAGFGELVVSNLQLVVAIDSGGNVSPAAKVYVSKFDGVEGRNSHYAACRLIWAATYIRLHRNLTYRGSQADETVIRAKALDEQLRFVRQFPDSDEWVAFLEKQTNR